MKIRISAAISSAILVIALASSAPFAKPALAIDGSGLQTVQYDRYPGPPPDRYDGNPDQRRDGYNDREYRGPKWRPGQVVPGQFLNRVVPDWEERGLSRPPNGHQWIRVGQQFLLVRASDRMIARILNFD
jgi:Ni/Co efflux regulator RcnB